MMMNTEERSMPVCNNHNKKKQYLCLNEKCTQPRIICAICAKEKHPKHKIGSIDKLIDPLNRLNQNSFHP